MMLLFRKATIPHKENGKKQSNKFSIFKFILHFKITIVFVHHGRTHDNMHSDDSSCNFSDWKSRFRKRSVVFQYLSSINKLHIIDRLGSIFFICKIDSTKVSIVINSTNYKQFQSKTHFPTKREKQGPPKEQQDKR